MLTPQFQQHGTLQEMTVTTKAKYDSKCHAVLLSRGRVTTNWPCQPGVTAQDRLPDLLCLCIDHSLVFGPQTRLVLAVFNRYLSSVLLEIGHKCTSWREMCCLHVVFTLRMFYLLILKEAWIRLNHKGITTKPKLNFEIWKRFFFYFQM